jgi:hypothetical protein
MQASAAAAFAPRPARHRPAPPVWRFVAPIRVFVIRRLTHLGSLAILLTGQLFISARRLKVPGEARRPTQRVAPFPAGPIRLHHRAAT